MVESVEASKGKGYGRNVREGVRECQSMHAEIFPGKYLQGGGKKGQSPDTASIHRGGGVAS